MLLRLQAKERDEVKGRRGESLEEWQRGQSREEGRTRLPDVGEGDHHRRQRAALQNVRHLSVGRVHKPHGLERGGRGEAGGKGAAAHMLKKARKRGKERERARKKESEGEDEACVLSSSCSS